MLTKDDAERLAAWVNQHDTGASPAGQVEERAGGYVVLISGIEVHRDGHQTTCVEVARDLGQARAILGY